MKFVQRDLGDAAEVSSGGGLPGFAREALKLIALCILLFTAVYFGVGLVTDMILSRISVEREQALFAKLELPTSGLSLPEEHQATWQMAEHALERLQRGPTVPALDFRLTYLPNPEPNAFALPGGTIALTDGLLKALEGDEIALAFVLGHELGHFAHRDHLRGLGRRIGWSVSLMLLFGTQPEGITSRSSELVFLHYSRKQEASADAFGLDCLETIYGQTNGAEKLFELLAKDRDPPRWAYMFSTHPDARERLQTLAEQRAGT